MLSCISFSNESVNLSVNWQQKNGETRTTEYTHFDRAKVFPDLFFYFPFGFMCVLRLILILMLEHFRSQRLNKSLCVWGSGFWAWLGAAWMCQFLEGLGSAFIG